MPDRPKSYKDVLKDHRDTLKRALGELDEERADLKDELEEIDEILGEAHRQEPRRAPDRGRVQQAMKDQKDRK